MTILHTSKPYTPEEIYRLTKDASVEKLSDHKGEVITVVGYIYYSETQKDKDGKESENEILCFERDDGSAIGTNSPTVRKTWFTMLDIFGETPIYPRDLMIFEDTATKSGRKYMNIKLA